MIVKEVSSTRSNLQKYERENQQCSGRCLLTTGQALYPRPKNYKYQTAETPHLPLHFGPHEHKSGFFIGSGWVRINGHCKVDDMLFMSRSMLLLLGEESLLYRLHRY
jgi:hypothetical protein